MATHAFDPRRWRQWISVFQDSLGYTEKLSGKQINEETKKELDLGAGRKQTLLKALMHVRMPSSGRSLPGQHFVSVLD